MQKNWEVGRRDAGAPAAVVFQEIEDGAWTRLHCVEI